MCSLSMDTVEGENSVVVILPHVHSGIELCVLRVRGIVLRAGVFFLIQQICMFSYLKLNLC